MTALGVGTSASDEEMSAKSLMRGRTSMGGGLRGQPQVCYMLDTAQANKGGF